MKRTMKARLFVSVLALSLLASCGPKEPAPSQAANPAPGQSDAPGVEQGKTLDKLVYAVSGEPQYLDPALCMDSTTTAIVTQMYYGLFEYDRDGVVQPKACESYDVSDDGLTYTLHLRDGNTWSDGEPVTAEQYVYGMKRSISYGPDAAYSYLLYDYVAGADEAHANGTEVEDMDNVAIKALDDKTIEITLKAPCSYFTGMLTNPVAFPLRQEFTAPHESVWANDPSVPTNGPFKLVSVNPREEVVMTKNEHFIEADKVTVNNLTARVIIDAQAQLAAFETGEIDVALKVPVDAATIYAGQEELADLGHTVKNTFLWINGTGDTCEALADVRVRQALSLAIDRDQIIQVAGAPQTRYPLYGYVPKGIAGNTGDFREEADAAGHYTEYDLERAKTLIKEAGYGEGGKPLTIKLSHVSSGTNSDICVAIQSMWQQIGVDCELNGTEGRANMEERKSGNYMINLGSTSADYIDPFYYLERWVSTNQAYKQVNDPHYDELIIAANAELDPAKRIDMLHDAEEYLVKEMMHTSPLFGSDDIILVRAGLTGIQHDAAGNLRYCFVTEK